MTRVLIIDDDAAFGEVLAEYCRGFSIELEQALTPGAGLEAAASGRFEAVILDVMLPGMTGFDVLRKLRETSDLPVLMLSARGELTDRVVGLEIGADDYLAKPFEPRELVARVLANVKRHVPGARRTEEVRRFGGLEIDVAMRTVRVDGIDVGLTTMEHDLLALLSATPGRALSRDAILAELKGTEHELFSRSVDILVSRVRQKLRPLAPIRTLHGTGYAFIARSTDERDP